MKKTDRKPRADEPLPVDWTGGLVCPGIVVSSRVRIARNLASIPFPDRLTPDGRRSVRDALFRRIQEGGDARWHVCSLDGMEPDDLLRMQECQLATPELTQRDGGAGLLMFQPDGARTPVQRRGRRSRVTAAKGPPPIADALVNEEDHLRFQCITPGGALTDAYQTAFEMETALDGTAAEYAYDPTYGYLTSCPSNLGTGLRVGMMLQLVGLFLAGDLEKTLRGLERLGLEARGIHGEGAADAPGCLYQVSNAETLGESEEEILCRMSDILQDLAMQEDWARVRLFEDRPKALEDYVCRSVAIGCEARLLSVDEAISLYYAGLFGLEMGLLALDPIPTPYEQMRPFLPPASAKKIAGRKHLSDDELAEMRATVVKDIFVHFRLPG